MDLLKEKPILSWSQTHQQKLYLENGNIITSFRKFLLIGGQETGTKSQMIESATKYKYHNNKILVIGDSFADLNAANDNKANFFIQLYHQRKKNRGIFLNRGIKDFFNLDYKEKIEKIKINEFTIFLVNCIINKTIIII